MLSSGEEDVKDCWVIADKDVTLIRTSSPVRFFTHIALEGNYIPPEEDNTVLLKPATQWHFSTPNGDLYSTFPFRDGPSNVIELHLGKMERIALTFFREPRRIGSVVDDLVTAFADNEPSFIEKRAIQLIRDLLRMSILCPV
jgi:hypothetical protein